MKLKTRGPLPRPAAWPRPAPRAARPRSSSSRCWSTAPAPTRPTAPWANGFVDYLKLVNARGGINGVKIAFEECETGYATDKGRRVLRAPEGQGAPPVFQPLSTGITFALTDKAPGDKIPLITAGYGRRHRRRRRVQSGTSRSWAPTGPAPTSWCSTSPRRRRLTSSRGKKIALVYPRQPVRQGADPAAAERAKMHGFDLQLLPVTHPGVEQKATWLQIRQSARLRACGAGA